MQSPERKILDDWGIIAIGKKFNVEANEVLLIHRNIFKSRGVEPDTIGTEMLLRDLEKIAS